MDTKYHLMIVAIANFVAEQNAENKAEMIEGGEDVGDDYGINAETVEAYVSRDDLYSDVVEVLKNLK